MSHDEQETIEEQEFYLGLHGKETRRTDTLSYYTTTLTSPWLNDHCSGCGHTFRVGDKVREDSSGKMRHDSFALPCSGVRGFAEIQPSERDIHDLITGMFETWPQAYAKPIVLAEDHPLTRSRLNGKRANCPVCGHTLRPRDTVMVCPCHAIEGPKFHGIQCQIAVHHDALHGHFCFAEMLASLQSLRCPASLRRVHG